MSKEIKPRRCTLQDIAGKTGFTVNTVSRALKNKSDISVATREHIQAVANEMGYIRNTAASSLRSGRTKTLGVIVGGMSNPYYGIMTDAIQNIAAQKGYSLLIFCSRDDADLEMQVVESAMSRQVDGILLFPCNGSERTVERMQAVGMPYVLMARTLEDGMSDSVVCDEETGAYLATQHMIKAGHRKLAFLSSFSVLYSSPQRMAGYRRACHEAGIPESDAYTARFRDEEDTLRQLLEWRDAGVTGVFVFCDLEAWRAIALLESQGVSVPKDMAVVSFDNIQGSLPFPSPLCTIDYSMADIAAAGIDLLRKRIHGEDLAPQRIVFAPRVVCRGSCGTKDAPPPAAFSQMYTICPAPTSR